MNTAAKEEKETPQPTKVDLLKTRTALSVLAMRLIGFPADRIEVVPTDAISFVRQCASRVKREDFLPYEKKIGRNMGVSQQGVDLDRLRRYCVDFGNDLIAGMPIHACARVYKNIIDEFEAVMLVACSEFAECVRWIKAEEQNGVIVAWPTDKTIDLICQINHIHNTQGFSKAGKALRTWIDADVSLAELLTAICGEYEWPLL